MARAEIKQKTLVLPLKTANRIQELADRDRRSFSSMAAILLEEAADRIDAQHQDHLQIAAGKTQIDPSLVERSR
jgi:hypothetical protein